MMHAANAAPIEKPFWTPGVKLLLLLGLVGVAAAIYRFVFGLEAATNLSVHYPWGIWKAISVAAAVALATGGFTTAALVHVFHRVRYERLVRPALVVGLVGYAFGATSLAVDLGRYYNIWHPAWPSMWQGDSVLFEVAMCIMCYLTILCFEFVPIMCERWRGNVDFPGALAIFNRPVEGLIFLSDRFLGKVLSGLLLIGVVLSCMHHSSLGSLMLVAPYKMHELWFTPVLPLLFLLSVFPVGFATLIAVAIGTEWGIGRRPHMVLYARLARYVLILQGIYMVAKVSDVVVREAHPALFELNAQAMLWWVEVMVGGMIPWIMLASRRVRYSPVLLTAACCCLVFGLVLNRVNVFLTAYSSPYDDGFYFPSIIELVLTGGLIALFMVLFRALLTFFPVWPRDEDGAPAASS